MPPRVSTRPGTQQVPNSCLVYFSDLGDVFSRLWLYTGVFPNKSQLSCLNIILPVKQSKAKLPEFRNSSDARNLAIWVFKSSFLKIKGSVTVMERNNGSDLRKNVEQFSRRVNPVYFRYSHKKPIHSLLNTKPNIQYEVIWDLENNKNNSIKVTVTLSFGIVIWDSSKFEAFQEFIPFYCWVIFYYLDIP